MYKMRHRYSKDGVEFNFEQEYYTMGKFVQAIRHVNRQIEKWRDKYGITDYHVSIGEPDYPVHYLEKENKNAYR